MKIIITERQSKRLKRIIKEESEYDMEEIIYDIMEIASNYGLDDIEDDDQTSVVRRVLSESPTGKINGRDYVINRDGTISIKNNSDKSIKIRFSGLSLAINIVDMTFSDNQYLITSKNGTQKEIDLDQTNDIIEFVDGTKNETSISSGMFLPSLVLKKIYN